MKESKIINYDEFLNKNLKQLTRNYKSRQKHIFKTYFYEYCNFVYIGMKMGVWIPKEYKQGIIIRKG